ncbi:MAG TPA: DUF4147 domain-containing protein [Acidobacteriaceae bacterium]|nr:DUF4147 domain-containing protein [Acidobacteriaceae bacterium]
MEDLKQLVRDIFTHALADCSIPHAFDRVLHLEQAHLLVADLPPIALDRLKHLRIVAAGKAAAPMLEALLDRLPLPADCDLSGVLIAPTQPRTLPVSIRYFPGGHPSPNQPSFDGASAALTAVREIADLPPDEALCLFLISGGASSMMELPLDASISLDDTVAFHRELVHSGATIVEMNCVRKHFSAIKGGRLALAAGSARRLTFLVSDVPPTHLDALASGPTLPDTTTVTECREILARYSLLERFPASVRDFFSSTFPETPKPGELNSPFVTLLDSDEFARTAAARAEALGFHAIIDNSCDDWPFDRAAGHLLARLREARLTHPRCCIVSTGEVSVRVPHFEKPAPHFDDSASHTGGRNQHLALYLATLLRADDSPIAILSAGSDGIDGNSTAAGAVIDARTVAENPGAALRSLAAFDSGAWLAAHDAAIVTGPTGQNLRDLRILLADSGS